MQKPKLYIIRKYIKATSAASAIRQDKKTPVHDVWVDEDWKTKSLSHAIGFAEISPEEEDDEE